MENLQITVGNAPLLRAGVRRRIVQEEMETIYNEDILIEVVRESIQITRTPVYQTAMRDEEEEEVGNPTGEEQGEEGAMRELDVLVTEEERMYLEAQAVMMLSLERAVESVRGRRDETGSEEEPDVEHNGEEGRVEVAEGAEEVAEINGIENENLDLLTEIFGSVAEVAEWELYDDLE